MQFLLVILLACPVMVAQAQDNDDLLADDQSLVDEEFSFSQLFEQTYGILVGYGGPRYRLSLGASYFVTNYLNVNLTFGMFGEHQPQEEDNDERKRNNDQLAKKAKTMAGNVQLRYYPHAKLPLSVFVGTGLAHWGGSSETGNGDDKYQSWEVYGESGVVVFYFWRGLYVESTILGVAGGHSFGLKSEADKATKKKITKEIEELDQYGMLAGTWNFTVGYYF